MTTASTIRKFELGAIAITPGVGRLDPLGLMVPGLLQRHQSGDWGNVCEDDAAENNYSVDRRLRILSSYTLKGEKVWVITEADRSATTVLLPSEY